MTEYKKLFPGQEPDEKIYQIIRKHWFVYTPIFILAIVMVLPVILIPFFWPTLFYADSALAGNTVIVIMSAYLLLVLVCLTVAFVSYYLDIYIITDKRIVDISQVGIFKREISELHLRQVQDVNAKVSGLFSTTLDFGDVFIQSAGVKENFIFLSVPEPYLIAKKIADLHEAQVEGADMDLLFQPAHNTFTKDLVPPVKKKKKTSK